MRRSAPRGATRASVLAYLVREADLDGVVILPYREIGAALDISIGSVGFHVRNLAAEGLLTHDSDATEHNGMTVIQLADEVLS